MKKIKLNKKILAIAVLTTICVALVFILLHKDKEENEIHNAYMRSEKIINNISDDLTLTDIYISSEEEHNFYFVFSNDDKVKLIYGEETLDDIFVVSDDYSFENEYLYVESHKVLSQKGVSNCLDYLKNKSEINKIPPFKKFKIKL